MNATAQSLPLSTTLAAGAPDIQTVKARMQATWEDGDYASFARYMEHGAEEILHAWGIRPGQELLDVGCGSGQTAIPAARNGARATGVDIAANLVDAARQRAVAEGLAVRFDHGDAENLPYPDASFDVVTSLIGAMFAPRPERVRDEMARVLRPGGRLYMANWTGASMPAQMFKLVASITPPPPGVAVPVLWGEEGTVRERLEGAFTHIRLRRIQYPQWHYPFDADRLTDLFRTHFGPVKRAFDSLDGDGAGDLHRRLSAVFRANSRYDGQTLTITNGELLLVSATRR